MATGEREERASFLGGSWLGRRLGGVFPSGGGLGAGPVPKELRILPSLPWPGDAQRGRQVLENAFPLTDGYVVDLDLPWARLSELPPLLADELHRSDWLIDLRAVGGDAARRRARTLVEAWLDKFEKGDARGWRPEVAGPRLAAWIGTYDFFLSSADDQFRERVLRSIAKQVRHMAKTGAGNLTGPEVFQALKGLLWGQIALAGDREEDLEAGLVPLERALDREISLQILADGGHISRNPGALVTLLRDLVDLRTGFRAAHLPVLGSLQTAIDKVAPALRFFRHGDGGLALFHGANEGDATHIDTLLTQADAKGRPLKSARHSGYERVLTGRTLLLVDVGGQPPPGQDRDLHAGPLSFELSLGRERVVTNCGAVPRPTGPEKASETREQRAWFDAMRRTPAHSTLTIEGVDTTELDREATRRESVDLQLTCDRIEMDGAVLIDATHNGFRQRFGAMHRRRLYISHQGDDLRGEDIITGPADLGIAIRFHLHPKCRVSLAEDGQTVLVALPSGLGWRFRAQGAALALEDSVYLGQGGDRRRTTQIVLESTTDREGLSVKWAFKRS